MQGNSLHSPVILTCALVGAELSREQTPYLPLTPDELAASAAEAQAAGAAIVHLHVRDEQGRPTCSDQVFRATIEKIRATGGVRPKLGIDCVGGSATARLGEAVAEHLDGLRGEQTGLVGAELSSRGSRTLDRRADPLGVEGSGVAVASDHGDRQARGTSRCGNQLGGDGLGLWR